MKSLALLLCLLPLPLAAHKGHEHSLSATAQVAVKAAETAVIGGAAAVTTAAAVAPKLDWVALLKASSSSHRHNKIVHFPIALGLTGCLFLLFSAKFQSLKPGARWMLFLAALSSVAAIYTGGLQEDSVEGAAMKQVLEVHSGLGWGVCGGLWMVWLLSFVESSKSWLWALMLLLCAAILLTGTLGGALAHMQF